MPTVDRHVCRYDLGPLKMLVRYEADAQIAASSSSTAGSTASVHDLANLLAKTSLTTPSKSNKTASSGSAIPYQLSSVSIPDQASLMEIKTRPSHKPFDPTSYWDQLFFSQTPHFWLATYLYSGTFPQNKLYKYELAKGDLKDFGVSEGMTTVARTVRILLAMKEVVVRRGKEGEGVSFVYEEGTEGLQVWKTKEGTRRRLVGEDVKALFG